MKYIFTRKKYSIVLAAIALTTAVFWFARIGLQPASAGLRDGSVRFISESVVGLTFEQFARVCIGTTDPRGSELAWSVHFSDQDGTLLFQLPEQRSPAGAWRCADISRGMLPVAGDAGTGRAQVAMAIEVKAPAGTKSSEIIGSAEIIAATGNTEAHYPIMLEEVLLSNFNCC